MHLRVLKLGWEFPPFNHGGLGVACEGLVRGLIDHGVRVLLVLPRKQKISVDQCSLISTDEYPLLCNITVDSLLKPYHSSGSYQADYLEDDVRSQLYGPHLFAEIERYAHVVEAISSEHHFDVIHAHDWMSFLAGIRAKQRIKKPLIVHVHATEFDRTGGNSCNVRVKEIEQRGMEYADKVITVSNYTKRLLIKNYRIDANKVVVIRNGITQKNKRKYPPTQTNKPTVLFLGRLTLQKGPDYFVQVAQKVLEHRPNVQFIVAGGGDMERRLITWVLRAGLSDRIVFTGHLRGDEVDRVYRLADVYVMPSVSEPFGITALEAMSNSVPVIVAKQAGVSEFVNHILKTDFWDIHEMANKVIALLDHRELRNELVWHARREVEHLTWHDPARQCIDLYKECLA